MKSRKVRKLISAALSVALCSAGVIGSAPVFASGKSAKNSSVASPNAPKVIRAKDETQIIGQMTVTGSVTLNDKRALNGTSIFSNSRIQVACAKGNGAIVNLGRMGRIELTPGSQMLLRFADGLISGELLMGNITVNSAAGVKVSINTPEGVMAADGKEPAVIPVRTQRGVRCVPMAVTSSSASSPLLSASLLAPLLLGIGGAVIAGVIAADDQNVTPTQIQPASSN